MAEVKETSTKQVANEPVFTKDQIANSKKYTGNRDLIEALLEDGKTYKLSEVDKLINDYKKGAVK